MFLYFKSLKRYYMKMRKIIASVFLLSSLGMIGCNTDNVVENNEDSGETGYYDKMMNEMLNSDTLDVTTDIDYYKFRLSYLKDNRDFQKTLDSVESVSAASDLAYSANDNDKVIDILLNALIDDFTNIGYHVMLGFLYSEKGMTADSELHYALADGLVGSIVDGRDGKTKETAYEVFIPAEEFDLMDYFAYEIIDSRQEDVGNSVYDIAKVKNADGEEAEVYFDITQAIKYLE